jgi:hypothetical protein
LARRRGGLGEPDDRSGLTPMDLLRPASSGTMAEAVGRPGGER